MRAFDSSLLLEFLLYMCSMVRMDLGSNSLDVTSLKLSADTAASHTTRLCVSQGIVFLALRFHFFVYVNLRPSPWSSRVPV